LADNLTTQSTTLATVPASSVIATDDVAGVHFQKVKLDVGGDGATAVLSNSNPLPISDAGGSLTVDGSVSVSALPAGSQAAATVVTADYDTGAGTQDMPLQGLALPASGGAVAGGTFTNPVRVDPTGTTVQPVSDGGGSLTIDGSVSLAAAIPAGTANIGDVDVASIATGDNVVGRVKLTDGTTVADVFDYTNANPIAVRLTDTNGDYVAAGAGTQYTEDAAAAANPVGTAPILVRADSPAALVSADGDNVAQRGTNYGAAYVQVVSSAGAFVDTFGGGTQYTEDAASAADPVGNMLIVRRRDTLSGTEVSADGDNIAVNATSKGEIYVKQTDAVPVTDNGGALTVDNGGTFPVQVDGAALTALQLIDDPVATLGTTTYTEAATKGMIMGAVRRDADTTLVDTTNEVGPLQMDANGRLKVEAFSGETLPVSLASVPSHPVTNAGTFPVQVDGAALTALQLIDNLVLAEDAAHTTADPGVQVLAVRQSTPANLSGANGDYEPLQVNGGRLWASATIDAALPAGTNNIGDVDVLTLPNVTLAAGTNTNEVVGDAAHDAAVAGNPVLVGAEARSTDGTAVGSGDAVRILATLLGKQVVQPHALPGATWSYAAGSGGITNTTAVTIKTAGAAGVRNYITALQVVNSHATVSTEFSIRDGASGTVLWRQNLVAAGGGLSVTFPTPIRGSAATLLEVVCGTTGAAVYFNAQGYEAAE